MVHVCGQSEIKQIWSICNEYCGIECHENFSSVAYGSENIAVNFIGIVFFSDSRILHIWRLGGRVYD